MVNQNDSQVETHRLVHWKVDKAITCVRGPEACLTLLKEIDGNYRGTLLSRILKMKKQNPILLEEAIQLMIDSETEAKNSGQNHCEFGGVLYFSFNFIEWLSRIGYHVELTGDEFELYAISEIRT